MEDNNENQALEKVEQPVNAVEASTETANETPVTQDSENKQYIPRKNRRNRSGNAASQGNNAQNSSCGEIEDLSQATEKLSGKHIGGYENGSQSETENQSEDGERRPRHDREERGERRGRNDRGDRRERGDRNDRRERGERGERQNREDRRPRREESSENTAEASNESSENESPKKSDGPSFEQPQTRSRAVEVSLDKRPKDARKDAPKQNFVSYSEPPKKGIIARIKDMLKSLFSKKPKSSPKFKNEGRRTDGFTKDRRGDRKNNGNRHYGNRHHGGGKNGGRRGDGQHRRHHNNKDRKPGASE